MTLSSLHTQTFIYQNIDAFVARFKKQIQQKVPACHIKILSMLVVTVYAFKAYKISKLKN